MKSSKQILYVAIATIVCGILVGFVSLFWTPYHPYTMDESSILQGPSWAHLLGTDALGRDLVSRLMVATTITWFVSFAGAMSTMVLGILFGVTAGYIGGWYDRVLQCIVTIFQSVPSISFMIALAGILEPSLQTLLISITLTSWVAFSRVIRAEVLSMKEEPYMAQIRQLGASHTYVLWYYVLRKVRPLLIVLFTTRVSYTMLAMSSLSFLGLGIQPPMADWGTLVQEGYTYFRTYPALLYGPGLCIVAMCTSIHYVGEWLRQYYGEL